MTRSSFVGTQRWLVALSMALGCSASGGDELGRGDRALISDQFHHDGTVGFMFLPPLFPEPPFSGTFEPLASPTVRVDEIYGYGVIRQVVLQAPAVLEATEERFRYDWDTSQYTLSTDAIYRIRVFAPDGRQLGFADVDLMAAQREIRNLDTQEYIPLVDGRTLRVRFRVERAAVDRDGDGVLDWQDGCPLTAGRTVPGPCGCDADEVDADGDGAADCVDLCPADPAKTAAGACGCGVADADVDADGAADCIDGCPSDPAKTSGGACGCGVADVDSDADGAPDCLDACSTDPGKLEPGACGCGTVDADADGDGAADCTDGCPTDPGKTAPGVCDCGVADADADADGTADCFDDCATDPGKTAPGVCGCGVADEDVDGDGAADCLDACPADPAKLSPGACGCGTVDADSDGDGAADCVDACPLDPTKSVPSACGCDGPCEALLALDLAVTGFYDMDGDGVISPGDRIDYVLSYANVGAGDATNVSLIADLNEAHFNFALGISGGGYYDGDWLVWAIGVLPAGASGSVSWTAGLTSTFPAGETPVGTTAALSSASTPTITVSATVSVFGP